MSATEIRDLAMQLPPDERALLARDLLSSVADAASTKDGADGGEATMIQRLVAITSHLFQSPVTVKVSYDPEFPDEKHTVFIAETSADQATILNLEGQWNRQVTQLFPGWHGYRLSVRRKK